MTRFQSPWLTLGILTLGAMAACDEPPTAPAGDNPDISFAKGGNGNGGGGGPGGGGGECSDIAVDLVFDPDSPDQAAGFDGDGGGAYVDGVDGVGASIQCDGNFDVQLRSGLRKNDPQIRYMNAHAEASDGSFAGVGPDSADVRIKSGNAFDVMAIAAGDSEGVGLSMTWEDAAGIRYQVRYGDAPGADTDCGADWGDTANYVTVDHPDADTWVFTGGSGLLCSMDTNDRKATPQPVGMVTAPFAITATRQP